MATGPDDGAERVARAERLVGFFHQPPRAFAEFAPVTADRMPQPFRRLLAHESHMTVAMERFYGGPVEVNVVAVHANEAGAGEWYEREILLRVPNGPAIQHGIVRIDLGSVAADVAARIRAGVEPLGRILIGAGVLLEVRHVGLLGVKIGAELAALLADGGPQPKTAPQTFGRVAGIAVAGVPAVELLEIVAPGPLPKVLQ